ncbi:MAG: dihydroorotate dehydrogenase [Pseudomonadota bacterium]
MSKHDDNPGLDLYGLFAEAKSARVPSSERLNARIIADAAALQARPVATRGVPRRNFFSRALEGLGGWPALGGLATAAGAGIYLGFAQPDFLAGGVEIVTDPGFAASSFLPGDNMFFEEG